MIAESFGTCAPSQSATRPYFRSPRPIAHARRGMIRLTSTPTAAKSRTAGRTRAHPPVKRDRSFSAQNCSTTRPATMSAGAAGRRNLRNHQFSWVQRYGRENPMFRSETRPKLLSAKLQHDQARHDERGRGRKEKPEEPPVLLGPAIRQVESDVPI